MLALGDIQCIPRLPYHTTMGTSQLVQLPAVNMSQNIAQQSEMYAERAHIMEESGSRDILPST